MSGSLNTPLGQDAPIAKQGPVRLIIADRSESAATAIESRLRDAGIATRLQYIDDVSLAVNSINESDLLLCNASLVGAEKAIPQLRKMAPNIPIVLITNSSDEPLNAEQGMLLGASDVVPVEQRERLLMVCQRELGNRNQFSQFNVLNKALAEAEQRCQLLLQSSKAAIAYVHEGMHIYANDGYLKLFGFADADDMLGLPIMDVLDADTCVALKKALKVFRHDADEVTLDFGGQNNNGDVVGGSMSLAAADYEGEACIQVTLRPVAELVAAPASTDEPAEQAQEPTPAAPDGIGEFLVRADQLFSDGANAAGCCAIFVASVDEPNKHLQESGLRGAELINDRIALTLQEALSPLPFTRLSRDQFALAISGQSRDAVKNKIDDIRSCIEALLLEINKKTVRPTISLGGADLESDGTPEACLEGAFSQLNKMRQDDEKGSKNSVRMASGSEKSQLDDEAARILQLINEAIEKQKFQLLFQPIISLRGDSEEHYEVFLRMQDRNGEVLVPHQFLKTAVDNGVAGKIDRWVILQSIKQLSVHRSRGHQTRLTINITCNSIAEEGFIKWLGVAIKAARLPSDAVIFQVTEQDAGTYLRQTQEFIESLKSLHCQTSLSRFGLGDDPFGQLANLSVDIVKLDGSLVHGMEDKDTVRKALQDTIKKLQNQGKLTVVPMVESANALSTLWQAGANYIQGHYLQEPSAEMAYDFTTDE